MGISRLVLTAAAAMMFAPASFAAIVVGPNINGVQTFTDTVSGRNWARMDRYFNFSHNSMVADLTGRGFTVATRPDLEALFARVDIANFTGVAAVMGRAPNRPMIWGSYSPLASNGTIDWAYVYDNGFGWQFGNLGVLPDSIQNEGTADADMNLWAFVAGDGGAVPEPATWALMIAGFGLVGVAARRRGGLVAQ